jgi:hypothetical protein
MAEFQGSWLEMEELRLVSPFLRLYHFFQGLEETLNEKWGWSDLML